MKKQLKYLAIYLDNQKANIFFMIILIVLAAILEILIPVVLKFIIDDGLVLKNKILFYKWISIFLLTGICSIIISFLTKIQTIRFVVKVMFNIKKNIIKNIMASKLDLFLNKNPSEIVTLLDRDVEITQYIYGEIATKILSITLLGAGVFVVMIKMNPAFAFITLIFLPVLIFNSTIGVTIIKKAQANFMSEYDKRAPFLNMLLSYHGQSQYRSWNLLGLKFEKFKKLENQLEKMITSKTLKSTTLESFVRVANLLVVFIIYFLGGNEVLAMKMSIGTLVSFTGLVAIFLPRLIELANLPIYFAAASLSFDRIHSFIESIEIENEGLERLNHNAIEVDFDKVSFKRGERVILNNLTFKIVPGEKIAIVGESGSGKSTIGFLVSGLLKDYTGNLKINGVEIKELSRESLASQVTWVSQEPFLENDSFANNIRFGSLADDATIHKILTNVKLEKFIDKISDLVGESGNKISGGEKQRLALARAFLKNSPIIIFDEVTSGLDEITSEQILNLILELSKDKIIIFITHKLAEAKKFDRIFKIGVKDAV